MFIEDALISLDDLEISVNYLNQAVMLLDELFEKTIMKTDLGIYLINFVLVNKCFTWNCYENI